MKKGIQYSHYCGTELMELVSCIRLSIQNSDNPKESKEWSKKALNTVTELRNKISELDKLNDMEY